MTRTMSAGGRLLAQRLSAVLGDTAPPGATGPTAGLEAAGPEAAGPEAADPTVGLGAAARADGLSAVAVESTDPPLPDYVAHVLARWTLLHDVPFRYLVPDARLLPPESIRFFRLDQGWLERLRAGALAVGGGDGSRERAVTATLLPRVDGPVAEHLPLVRDVQRNRISIPVAAELLAEERAERAALAAGSPGDAGPPNGVGSPDDAGPHDGTFPGDATGDRRAAADAVPITGFLLRSALVPGWPAMQIRAWASDLPADVPPGVDPDVLAAARPDLVVPLLRLQRLSPAVLLALFRGTPRLVWLQEPPQSVQFGLEPDGAGWRVPLRSAAGQETGSVAVPMRAGPLAGVVDVAALAGRLNTAAPTSAPHRGAGVAVSLLQAPSRQRFAASAAR
ncbi:hypothetical protein [Micromonospora okii]|uniref:hypothetical protein n=1 Tax=Micromonospora okii TaxID=1182970 RepID=UPI001E4960FC|nr:hypothetical protein [Micromonospora okii]